MLKPSHVVVTVCTLVGQRKQAAAAPPHFTHRAGCVMAHAAPLSPSSGEEAKVEVYCCCESSQQYPTVLLLCTVHSSPSSRELALFKLLFSTTPPSRDHDYHETTPPPPQRPAKPPNHKEAYHQRALDRCRHRHRTRTPLHQPHSFIRHTNTWIHAFAQ